MANLPGYLSVILDKFIKLNSLKRLVNGRRFSVAVFVALANCSVHAQSLQNDSDGDGLKDAYELKIGSESYLSDTDGDAVKDAQEVGENKDKPMDSDNDGVIDVLDYDDDNDGLPTYLESKKDSDKDGLLDYLDSDSDNDGIADGEEAGFLNQDKNLDGVDDAFDMNHDGAVDNNGDGINDNVKLPDHNGDGKPDYLDAKFQHLKHILVKKNKTKSMVEVLAKDISKSKKPDTKTTAEKSINYIDDQSKQKVVMLPKPSDMVINRHTDSDNDGLSNSLEKILGTNHLSRDSDGDKVSDAIEIGLDVNSPLDSDRDGIIDALDNDDDNDGILTILEDLNKDSTAINDDTDADGVPNYLDANDDGDNLLTKAEGFVSDSDGDGILDYLDKNDDVKDQSNSSNTMKVTKDNDAETEPEIVILFDGDAAALSAEEDMKIEVSLTSPVQDQLLSSLDGILQDSVLDEKNADTTNKLLNDKASEIQTSKSSNDRFSHWNLF